MIDLADHFRQETKAQHTAAERSALMRMFIKGEVPPPLYAEYLASLLVVYQALEGGLLANQDTPLVAEVTDTLVFRCAAIEADLQYLRRCGYDAKPCNAALQYAARLGMLAQSDPERLVSHAYTRYVGDLSGGRMLRRFIARALGVTDDAGLAFYSYEVPDTGALKDSYRGRFQGLELPESSVEALSDEACIAFTSNHRMFDELATAHSLRTQAPPIQSKRARRDSYAA